MNTAANRLRSDAHVIGLIGLAHGISHFFQLALPPLFLLIKTDFNVGYAELGVLVTCYYAMSGVGQALMGFVVDRLGAFRVLFAGLILIVLGTALAAMASSYATLVPAVVLMGIGNSVFHPADFSALNHRVTPSRLGHAFSVHGLSGNLGYAFAPVAMLSLAAAWNWHVALAVAAGVGVAFAALLWSQRRVIAFDLAARDAASSQPASLRATLRPLLSLAIASCFVFFICSAFASVGVQSFAPAILSAVYGLTPLAGASMLTAFLLAGAAGIFVGGFLASSALHHERVAGLGMGCGAVLFALLASGEVPASLLLIPMCLAGFVLGLAYPSRDMLVRAATPKGATGRTFGVVYCGTDIGAALGPGVLGWLLDHGRPDWTFLAIATVLAVNVALAYQAAARRPLPSDVRAT